MPKVEKRIVEIDYKNASLVEWQNYMVNQDAQWKDFSDFDDQTSACGVLFKKISQDKELLMPERLGVVTLIVQALINEWEQLPSYWDVSKGSQHPFDHIDVLAHVDGELCQETLSVIQRLWCQKEEYQDPKDYMVCRLIRGLGVLLPVDDDFLERLFVEYRNTNGLNVMLQRGSIKRGNELFLAHHRDIFGDCDPLSIDFLVWSGLSLESAMTWLDCSSNSNKGYEGWYNDAVERWPKIIAHRDV